MAGKISRNDPRHYAFAKKQPVKPVAKAPEAPKVPERKNETK
jgi:hypothetical protein